VQQSRARSKTDFLLAFEPLIGDATALAYKNASVEIQNKIRRVIEVWRQRAIFDAKIQDALEKRLDDIDKTRGAQRGIGGGGKLGGSLFGGGSGGGGIPSELESVSKSQTAVTKAETSARGIVATANAEHSKLTDPNTPLPSPPVHAAKLASLMKTLASAHSAVESSIKARTELIAGLEQLLENNRSGLATDQATAMELSDRLATTESRKREVEDGIMRGLSNPGTPSNQMAGPESVSSSNGANGNEPTAPDYEEFTPPPEVESFTPPPADAGENDRGAFAIGENVPAEQALADPSSAEVISEQQTTHDEPPTSHEPPPVLQSHTVKLDNIIGADILSSLQMPQVRHASSEIPSESADPRLKRRKMSHNQHEEAITVEGIDEDGVAALLQ
jgi:regulator of Ty1 transposition protein 103